MPREGLGSNLPPALGSLPRTLQGLWKRRLSEIPAARRTGHQETKRQEGAASRPGWRRTGWCLGVPALQPCYLRYHGAPSQGPWGHRGAVRLGLRASVVEAGTPSLPLPHQKAQGCTLNTKRHQQRAHSGAAKSEVWGSLVLGKLLLRRAGDRPLCPGLLTEAAGKRRDTAGRGKGGKGSLCTQTAWPGPSVPCT